MSKKSDAEVKLQQQLETLELPKPELELTFCDDRKWRFDFAWPSIMLAVEVEGGTWIRGRHTRPKGFEEDCKKYNEAAIMGWTVLRVTVPMINSGYAARMIEGAIDKFYALLYSGD